VKTDREKYLWVFQPRDLWIALGPASHPVQLFPNYRLVYSLGKILPSPDCGLLLKLSCSSACKGSHFLAMWRYGYARRLAALGKSLPASGGMLITVKYSSHHPYFFVTMVRGEFPPASLLCFFSHLLCSFQKNLVCPSGTTVGQHGREVYQHCCDIVRSFALEWESSEEYLRPAKSVQVQGISKPKSRILFSLEMEQR